MVSECAFNASLETSTWDYICGSVDHLKREEERSLRGKINGEELLREQQGCERSCMVAKEAMRCA